MSDKIRFFLNWKEYFAALEFLRASRATVSQEKIGGGLLIVASALLYLYSDSNLAPFAALALGLFFSFGISPIRRRASKSKWEREPLYHTEHTLSFGEEVIFLQMGNIESNLSWQYYRSVLESHEGFLLISGDEAFNFFPKRAFNGESLINQFRTLATAKLSNRSQN